MNSSSNDNQYDKSRYESSVQLPAGYPGNSWQYAEWYSDLCNYQYYYLVNDPYLRKLNPLTTPQYHPPGFNKPYGTVEQLTNGLALGGVPDFTQNVGNGPKFCPIASSSNGLGICHPQVNQFNQNRQQGVWVPSGHLLPNTVNVPCNTPVPPLNNPHFLMQRVQYALQGQQVAEQMYMQVPSLHPINCAPLTGAQLQQYCKQLEEVQMLELHQSLVQSKNDIRAREAKHSTRDIGWGKISPDILKLVISRLISRDLSAIRLTCKDWKLATDCNLVRLCPSSFQLGSILSLFPILKVIELSGCIVRSRDFRLLSRSGLNSLECLIIGNSTSTAWFTNAGLQDVAAIQSIKRLGLRNCNYVTNKGISELRHMTQLEQLELIGLHKISNLSFIPELSRLQQVSLHNCTRIAQEGINKLQKLNKLQGLMAGCLRLSSDSFSSVAQLHKLKSLQLRGCNFVKNIQELSQLQSLTSLSFRERTSSDEVIIAAGKISSLQHVDLQSCQCVADELLVASINSWQNLRSIDLRGTGFLSIPVLTTLANVTTLQSLSCTLPSTETSSRHATLLSSLRCLQTLCIEGSGPVDTGLFQYIAHLTALKQLSLVDPTYPNHSVHSSIPITISIVTALAVLTQISSLDLSGRPLTQTSASVILHHMPNVKVLGALHTSLQYTDVDALRQEHPGRYVALQPGLHDTHSGRTFGCLFGNATWSIEKGYRQGQGQSLWNEQQGQSSNNITQSC